MSGIDAVTIRAETTIDGTKQFTLAILALHRGKVYNVSVVSTTKDPMSDEILANVISSVRIDAK